LTEKVDYIIQLKDMMSSSLGKISSQVDMLDSRIRHTNTSASNFGSLFKSAIPFVAGAFAVDKVVGFGKGVVDALSNFESFQASLSTMLGGNQQQVTQLTEQLQRFATTTPFELTEIQDATRKLLAFGVGADDIEKSLRSIGDISSGIGAPISEIAEIYGKAKVQGRLFGEDINQLTGRGIPIIQELAKQFGVTDSEVKKLVEEGKVGFPNVEKAFADMTAQGGKFFNLMDAQSKTTGGQISNLSDSFNNLKLKIGIELKPVISSIIDGLSSFINLISNLINYIKRNQEVFLALGKGILFATGAFLLIKSAIIGYEAATNIATIATKAFNFVMSLNPIGLVVAAIGALIASFIYFWETSEKFRGFIYGLWGAIKAVFLNIAELGINVFKGIAKVIEGVITFDFKSINQGVGKLKDSFVNYGSQVADGFKKGFDSGVQDFISEKGIGKKGLSLSSAGFLGGFTKKSELPSSLSGSLASKGTAKKAQDIAGNSKPTNININITKLIERFEVIANNTKESSSDMKRIVVETLLGAVNNVNILANS